MGKRQLEVNQTASASLKRPSSVKLACLLLVLYLASSFFRVTFGGQYRVTADMLWVLSISAFLFLLIIAALYKGSRIARGVILFFACFNMGIALTMGVLFSNGAISGNLENWVNMIFNVICLFAVFLLFTPSARAWYKAQR